MPVVLGAIADDFTGATDLRNTPVRCGMKTEQLIDVPPPAAAARCPCRAAARCGCRRRRTSVADSRRRRRKNF
ncbi:MAG TPA: hypothetical protein VG308_05820 [Stellaceae bacterium]|nr:hypothetical protein [Stellaceae bacterium]